MAGCARAFRSFGAPVAALVTLALLSAAPSGCASVKVRKVPSPTQYSTWTDDDQRDADAMEGLRFYLPRPFVNVFESFPIATDIYLARGTVAPTGDYVVIESVEPLLGGAKRDIQIARELSNGVIFRPSAERMAATERLIEALGGAARPQSGDDSGGDGVDDRIDELTSEMLADRADNRLAIDDLRGRLDERAQPAPAGGEGETSGVATIRARNDNGAFAYLPMRGNLDIVYMPDFDEQYVVTTRSGLGNAQVAMNFGQGWSLQGLDATVDNSRLAELTFGLLETLADGARALATSGTSLAAMNFGQGWSLQGLDATVDNSRLAELTFGLLETLADGARALATSGTSLAADALSRAAGGLARPQAGEELAEAPGTPVMLKIVVVHYAAKGLYPVIKPRELTAVPPNAFVLDLVSKQDSIVSRALEAMSNDEVREAVRSFDRIQGRFTVPVYPYQYISFNTFQYVSIEALTAEGSAFGGLYDRTGTRGDAGDRQATDLSGTIRELLGAMPGGVDGRPVASLEVDNRFFAERGSAQLKELIQAKVDEEGSGLEGLTVSGVSANVAQTAGGEPALSVSVVMAESLTPGQSSLLQTIAEQQTRELVMSSKDLTAKSRYGDAPRVTLSSGG